MYLLITSWPGKHFESGSDYLEYCCQYSTCMPNFSKYIYIVANLYKNHSVFPNFFNFPDQFSNLSLHKNYIWIMNIYKKKKISKIGSSVFSLCTYQWTAFHFYLYIYISYFTILDISYSNLLIYYQCIKLKIFINRILVFNILIQTSNA